MKRRLLLTIEMTDDQIFRWVDLAETYGFTKPSHLERTSDAYKRQAIAFALQRFVNDVDSGQPPVANDG